jgi:hypothetical protein
LPLSDLAAFPELHGLTAMKAALYQQSEARDAPLYLPN